jgi:hypothetical protein
MVLVRFAHAHLLNRRGLLDSPFRLEPGLSFCLVVHLFFDLGLVQSVDDGVFSSWHMDCMSAEQ